MPRLVTWCPCLRGGVDAAEIVRVLAFGGSTGAAWNRLLVTPDEKDAPIAAADKVVMFAYGFDDQFTYHGVDRWFKCNMNFFSGSSKCAGHHHDD